MVKFRRIVFSGEYQGKPCSVTFTEVGLHIWDVVIQSGDQRKKVTAHRHIRPCTTHAGYVLAAHFPGPKRKTPTPHSRQVTHNVEDACGLRLFDESEETNDGRI